jgi:hypothetical protein
MQYFLPRLESWDSEAESRTCDEVIGRVHRATADREVLILGPAETPTRECLSRARLEPLGTFRFGADNPLELSRLQVAPDAFAIKGLEFRLPYARPSEVLYGFAPPQTNAGWDGGPLRAGGTDYPIGIGMHAWCRMTYEVPARAASFDSVVGLAEDVRSCPEADVVFEALDQDGRVLFDSGLVRPGDAPLHVHVELAGITRLTLAVTEGVNGPDCDHAVWGNPVIALRGEPEPSR